MKKFLIAHQKDIIIFMGALLACICDNIRYYYDVNLYYVIILILFSIYFIIYFIYKKRLDDLRAFYTSFLLAECFYFVIRLLFGK